MGSLRFYLALSVAFGHSIAYTNESFLFNGHASVTIFFLISGFIITYVLIKKYSGQTVLFYKNRFLRIFVPFFIIMLIIESAYFIFGNAPRSYYILENNYSFSATLLLFFSNIFLFGSNWLNLIENNMSEGLVIPQSWSLPIELLFYFFSPFIINAKIKKLLLFIFSLSLYLILLTLNKVDFARYLFLSNLFFFIIGIYSCKLMIKFNLEKKFKFNKLLKKFNNHFYFLILFFILFLNYLGFIFESSNMINIIFFNFLIALALPIIFCVSSNLEYHYKKIDNFFGNQSYYIYLIHVFIYLFLIKLDINLIDKKFTYFVTLIIFSYVSFTFIDPIEKKLRDYVK